MERRIPFIEGNYYHIYNRGTDRRTIFFDEHDHNRFVSLLYLSNGDMGVSMKELLGSGKKFTDLLKEERGEPYTDIGAYCLMPNHFHILVRERRNGGISKFMHKLQTSYAMYFNGRNKRTGTLFEGRFKAKSIDDEGYLKYLLSYIHLNPVKLIDPTWKDEGLSDLEYTHSFLSEYRYSSFLDYTGSKRPENVILEAEAFPEEFKNARDFSHMLDWWLSYSEKEKERNVITKKEKAIAVA